MTVPMRRPRVFAAAFVIVIATTLAAYSNTFQNSFHFDDSHVVENNLYIRNLKNLPRFFRDAATFSSLPANATYRPLVTATLAIDYWRGGGLEPRQFHVTQLTLLVLLTVMVLLPFPAAARRRRDRTGGTHSRRSPAPQSFGRAHHRHRDDEPDARALGAAVGDGRGRVVSRLPVPAVGPTHVSLPAADDRRRPRQEPGGGLRVRCFSSTSACSSSVSRWRRSVGWRAPSRAGGRPGEGAAGGRRERRGAALGGVDERRRRPPTVAARRWTTCRRSLGSGSTTGGCSSSRRGSPPTPTGR